MGTRSAIRKQSPARDPPRHGLPAAPVAGLHRFHANGLGVVLSPQGNPARFHDPEDLVKFLVGTVRNKLLHEERRRLGTEKSNIERERTASPADFDEYCASPGQAPSPVDTAIANEQRKCLERGLSPEESRMVRLRIEGLTQEEIGKVVGKPKSTVRDFFAGLRILTGS